MKKITITFVIVTIVFTLIDVALMFCPFDYARWGNLLNAITLGLNILPNILLASLIFLHYSKEGSLQDKLHQRYMYYMLVLVILLPLLGILLHSNDLYSDISSIIINIAITYVAIDLCKRQPAKCQWVRYMLYTFLGLTLIGIIFIPMPVNMIFTYLIILIYLYAIISAIIDAKLRKYPGRGWAYAAFIFASAIYIPAYLLETNHSKLEN